MSNTIEFSFDVNGSVNQTVELNEEAQGTVTKEEFIEALAAGTIETPLVHLMEDEVMNTEVVRIDDTGARQVIGNVTTQFFEEPVVGGWDLDDEDEATESDDD